VHELDQFIGPDGVEWLVRVRPQESNDHPELVHPLVVELLQPDGRARKARNVASEGLARAWGDLVRRAVEEGALRTR
jgi:hypothetical protein